jgi:acyl-CoA synthetase (AMP-forming)/AMP-acid ligase II
MILVPASYLTWPIERYPDRSCIGFERKTFTYREINRRVNRLANGLERLGSKMGDKIASLHHNCNQARLYALGKETTWEMYRRRLKILNRNKLIGFVGRYFGIFLSHEVIMLVDVPVHKTAQELGVTRTSIYTKYAGLSPP